MVVVTMASIKQHIADMVSQWLDWPDNTVKILSGRKPLSANLPKASKNNKTQARIYILNYDIAEAWEEFLYASKYKTLMIDESHLIKNPKTKRAEVVRRMADFAEGVIATTGTPVETSPMDILNQATTVRPDTFTNWWQFMNRYNPQTQIGYKSIDNPSNLEELEKRLRMTVMVRRTKKMVAPWLPEIERVPIKLGLNLSGYNDALKRLRLAMNQPGFAGLTIDAITELRQEAARAKVTGIVSWAKDVQQAGQPLVLFGHHHFLLDIVASELKAPILDGRTSQTHRYELMKYFQRGEIPILVGGTRAMGMGIELYKASHCATMEFDWNMTKHSQAEARFHRIEPVNPLTSYYFIGIGTLDERMMGLLGSKQAVSETVMGEPDHEKLIIDEVIKELEETDD